MLYTYMLDKISKKDPKEFGSTAFFRKKDLMGQTF